MTGEKVDPKCITTYQKTFFCCREHRDAFNKARDNNVEKVARFDRANGV